MKDLMKNLKNLGQFYFIAFIPLFLIMAYALVFGNHGIGWQILLYAVYRQIVDALRLVAIGSIPKTKLWYTIIPFYLHNIYFKDLYFKC